MAKKATQTHLESMWNSSEPSVCKQVLTYSRVPNKRTGRLLENEKKSHLYALIQDYTFINFQQKVPPICLFPPIRLFFFG